MTISEQMKVIATNHPVGMVGTVNKDFTPNVSPKGTMVVLDFQTIIFGEIRSPQTVANIKERPATEISFVDVLTRRCFRAQGTAEVLSKSTPEFQSLLPHFAKWSTLCDRIRHIVSLHVTKAFIVTSPIYDVGQTEAKLKHHWQQHFANL